MDVQRNKLFFSSHRRREKRDRRGRGQKGDKTWGGKPQLRPTKEKKVQNPCEKTNFKIPGPLQRQQTVFGGLLGVVLSLVTPKCVVLSNFAFCLLLLYHTFVGSEKKIYSTGSVWSWTHTEDLKAGSWRQWCPGSSQEPGEGQGCSGTVEPGAGQAPTDGVRGDLCLVLTVPHCLPV